MLYSRIIKLKFFIEVAFLFLMNKPSNILSLPLFLSLSLSLSLSCTVQALGALLDAAGVFEEDLFEGEPWGNKGVAEWLQLLSAPKPFDVKKRSKSQSEILWQPTALTHNNKPFPSSSSSSSSSFPLVIPHDDCVSPQEREGQWAWEVSGQCVMPLRLELCD